MKKHAFVWIAAAALAAGCQSSAPGTGAPAGPGFELETEEDRTYYALGAMMAGNLGKLEPRQSAALQAGIADATGLNPPQVDLQEYRPRVDEMMRARSRAKAADQRAQAEAFLAQAAQEEGARRSDSGIVYTTLEEGDGVLPGEGAVVRVHYRGTLIDGTEFDSSYARGEPAEFPLDGVIPCWTEGVGRMKVGGRAKLVCPPELAYGEQGRPPAIPGGAALIFEVELLETRSADAG
jgi:FKBP-type peptidyl-prolyl cis-trans isomerase FkpA